MRVGDEKWVQNTAVQRICSLAVRIRSTKSDLGNSRWQWVAFWGSTKPVPSPQHVITTTPPQHRPDTAVSTLMCITTERAHPRGALLEQTLTGVRKGGA